MPRRDHLLVIRELALDDLRDDVDIAEGKAHLVRSDRERYRLVAVPQELDQLDHGLARQDRLDRSVVRPQGARCVRQPMAFGRDDAKPPAFEVIWTSRSVARNSTREPEAEINTFDRMGRVCLRSTIPVTCASGPRSLSLVVLIFSIC